MKITRKMLMIITLSIGALLILYIAFRLITGIGLDEAANRHLMNAVIISALILFVCNRKLVKDEEVAKTEKETEEPKEEE